MTPVLLAAAALATLPPGAGEGSAPVRLNVRAMAAPRPALRYVLLPELAEFNPGNAAHEYLRCFAEQRNFFFSKESVADRARFLSMPLAELATQKNFGYGDRGALGRADWAARLDTVDWQELRRVQDEGTDLTLPELVPLRVLAEALQVRFRFEVAGRRFDDALRTAKTMFALARHLGEHPAGAANRLGLSVADRTLATLEEMAQQPGCPNLYWALTDLPCPPVELRKGTQGDRALVATDLRLIRDDAPMTPEQVEEVVSRLSGRMGFVREQAGRPPRSLRAALKARTTDAERVRAARSRLLAAHAEGRFGKFPPVQVIFVFMNVPPVQVILLDEKREYELRQDELLRLLPLAPWQIDALAGGAPAGGDGLFADLLPPVVEARRAQARLERRVALLRHVEALRLYAAAHDGRVPDQLADVGVPLPDDPFTGKPFAYSVEGQTARLGGGASRHGGGDSADNVTYAVTVRK